MLSEKPRSQIDKTESTSCACDLRKWLQIMEAYERGGHAYHATLPTDALNYLRNMMLEMASYGFLNLRDQQQELGDKARALLSRRGFKSVAATGFESPGVVVCYTEDPDIQSGKKFLQQGLQTAAGVPLRCNEPDDFQTFRLGLFGLDKLTHVDRTVKQLSKALSGIAKL